MINVHKDLGDGNCMEIYYGSKGVNNYIEVCINEKDFNVSKNNYVIRMLEDNEIGEIIKPAVSKLDNDLFLRYQVNSLFVLDKFFLKSKPDITVLKNILKSVCACVKISEQFLLNTDDLVISPDYMLWDYKDQKVRIIYAPFYNKKIQYQLKYFIEYIMRIFDYKSADGVMTLHHIYELITGEDLDINELERYVSDAMGEKGVDRLKYKLLDSSDNFSLVKNVENNVVYVNKDFNEKGNRMKEKETTLEEDDAIIVKEESRYEVIIGINAAVSGILFLTFLFINKEKVIFLLFLISIISLVINSFVYIFKKEKGDEIDIDKSMKEFEERYKINNDMDYCESINHKDNINTYEDVDYISNNFTYEYNNRETNKMNISMNKKEYKLIPLNDGMLEPIVINPDKKETVIGRGKNETDYRINKEQISMIHASIIIKSDGVYIKDQNSTNGTYINASKLEAYEEKLVSIGDIIRLANEEFFVG